MNKSLQANPSNHHLPKDFVIETEGNLLGTPKNLNLHTNEMQAGSDLNASDFIDEEVKIQKPRTEETQNHELQPNTSMPSNSQQHQLIHLSKTPDMTIESRRVNQIQPPDENLKQDDIPFDENLNSSKSKKKPGMHKKRSIFSFLRSLSKRKQTTRSENGQSPGSTGKSPETRARARSLWRFLGKKVENSSPMGIQNNPNDPRTTTVVTETELLSHRPEDQAEKPQSSGFFSKFKGRPRNISAPEPNTETKKERDTKKRRSWGGFLRTKKNLDDSAKMKDALGEGEIELEPEVRKRSASAQLARKQSKLDEQIIDIDTKGSGRKEKELKLTILSQGEQETQGRSQLTDRNNKSSIVSKYQNSGTRLKSDNDEDYSPRLQPEGKDIPTSAASPIPHIGANWSTAMKTVSWVVFYWALMQVVSLFSALAANTYPSASSFHRWGHGLFEGLFIAVMIASILRDILKRAEAGNPLVLYSRFWLPAVIALIISPLTSVLFFYIVDQANPRPASEELPEPSAFGSINPWANLSQFYYLLCKLPVVAVNFLIYEVYFLAKKFHHIKHSENQRKSFFYVDIYKNFQVELHKLKHQLDEKFKPKKNRSTQLELNVDETPKHLRNRPETTAEVMGKTIVDYRKVFSLTQNLAVHCIVVILYCQLLLSFGYLALVKAAFEEGAEVLIYIGAAFYPILTGLMKIVISRIDEKYNVGMENPLMQLVSMTIAAVSYRCIYFMIDEYAQAVGVLLFKLGYKIIIYAIYGSGINTYQKLWLNIKKKAHMLKKKCFQKWSKERVTTRRTLSLSLRATMSLSSSDKVHFVEDNLDEKQHIKVFSIRFGLLMVSDCTAIVCMNITTVILNHSSVVKNVFSQRYGADKLNRILGFSGIELAFDIFMLLIMAVIMKKSKLYREIKVLRMLNNLLRLSQVIFITTNFVVYYTFYLVFASYL